MGGFESLGYQKLVWCTTAVPLERAIKRGSAASARFDNVSDANGLRSARLKVFFRPMDDTWFGVSRVNNELIGVAVGQRE